MGEEKRKSKCEREMGVKIRKETNLKREERY